MFRDYLIQKLAVLYEDRVIIFDLDDIEGRYSYTDILKDMGFKILKYQDATHFRYVYDREFVTDDQRIAVVVSNKQYVPYDILNSFYPVDIGWDKLFPNLNREVIMNNKTLDLDLLYGAYNGLYENLSVYEEASNYILQKVYGKENVQNYLEQTKKELSEIIYAENLNYNAWIGIATKKGKAEYLAAQSGLSMDFSFVEGEFIKFILSDYKALSSLIQKNSPIMVSRVMDYIAKSNEKVALVVLDGMSVFDFYILAEESSDIEYEDNYIYAMVPTTTAISRQSLLSGKFPVELERPFELSREEKEFIQKAKNLGYLDNQILYARGYDSNIGPNVKCLCLIINDIDDLVHGQTQGRIGMYNDIKLLGKSGKLQSLIKRLFSEGFSVYLTSDHGNTLCRGLGMVKGTGVEVETRSKRMLILKDFAQSESVIASYNLIEYPGYYLKKQYKYYICSTGTSFDQKDSMIMTHGGISIDEVIVPFIKIKAVQNG